MSPVVLVLFNFKFLASTHSHKRTYEEAFHNNSEPLQESEMDDLAEQIFRSWRQIGRKLNLSLIGVGI